MMSIHEPYLRAAMLCTFHLQPGVWANFRFHNVRGVSLESRKAIVPLVILYNSFLDNTTKYTRHLQVHLLIQSVVKNKASKVDDSLT